MNSTSKYVENCLDNIRNSTPKIKKLIVFIRTKLRKFHIFQGFREKVSPALASLLDKIMNSGMFPLELLEKTVMQDHFVCMKRDELLKSFFQELEAHPDIHISLGETYVTQSKY